MIATASPERIEHALQVLSSLENMKSREFICDFKVKVGNHCFNAHRALLAACSGYFEALFSSNMKEAQDGFITMKDVGVNPIEQCIKYMYTGTYALTMDSVEEIVHASNLLQIQSLEKKCFNFLKSRLEPDNCLSILNLARTFDHQDVEKAAEDLVVSSLETVILSDLFLKISKKDVLRYISHANHETSWRAVRTWSKGRQKEFEELAEQIDFSRLPFRILLNEALNDPLVNKSQKIKDVVQQSLFADPRKLVKNLDFNNCFRLKKFATDEKSKKIIDSFMCKNFSTIISNPQFCDLSKDGVIRLLKSPEIDSEESKWEASLKWVKHDLKGRKTSFPDLFSSLKLMHLPLKFLKETVRNEELVRKSNSCMNLLVDATINYAEQSEEIRSVKSFKTSKVDVPTTCYKLQPPGGQVEEKVQWLSELLTFKFKSGSYEGIRYSGCSFKYQIPNDLLSTRLQNIFNARQLFKLQHEPGSNEGKVVLSDIPLESERGSLSSDGQTYVENLSRELEKKGF